MRKTFTTQMPDRAGAFFIASRIISEAGGNITRVSYNKAIDTHTLFVEVDGAPRQLEMISSKLEQAGYLGDGGTQGKVILMEFKLEDRPGAVFPVLELINRYDFNISYISSQENGTPYQYFKMGLFIDNTADVAAFLTNVSRLCEVRIIHYDKSGKTLDNTVFYMSFASAIAKKLSLSETDTKELVVQSNRVMQILDEKNQSPYQTFEYIGKFADCLVKWMGNGFHPRISHWELKSGGALHLIEPPCGSNTWILERNGKLLFFDSGFACYRNEMEMVLRNLFPSFERMEKQIAITHVDVDHSGLLDWFNVVYVSQESYNNFCLEQEGRANFREQNPIHAPYSTISKLLTGYHPPEIVRLHRIGGKPSEKQNELLTPIGKLFFEGLEFQVIEGKGGHIRGECIFLCSEEKLAVTGDVFVNLKDMNQEQVEFNRLAPFLMTNVDTDPMTASDERKELLSMLRGEWSICGGHGGMFHWNGREK